MEIQFDKINELANDRNFQREAANIQAKALLGEIAGEIPDYEWKYLPNRIVKNLTFGTLNFLEASFRDYEALEALLDDALKFAHIWEALSKTEEGVSKEQALINSAINYELAGYQANASCLASKLLQELETDKFITSPIGLISLFINRKLLKLRKITRNIVAAPDADQMNGQDFLYKVAEGSLAKGLNSITTYLLQGEHQRIGEAQDFLRQAEDIWTKLSFANESFMVRSFIKLVPTVIERSTWKYLHDVSDNPKWNRYLQLLARGLGEQVLESRSISQLWPSQTKALEAQLLDSEKNMIIRMPTSAGKTRLAEMAIVHELSESDDSKCIYVAPYRALVAELKKSLLDLLNDLGYRASTILGSFELDEFEEAQLLAADVLILTPEKLDLLSRISPETIEKVGLYILDEAQLTHDITRGPKYELLLTRIRRKYPEARFLLISAVVPQASLEYFGNWLSGSAGSTVLNSSWRPSSQRYAKFEWSGKTGVIRYAPDDEIKGLEEFVPGVIRQKKYKYENQETERIEHEEFPDLTSKSQTAAELAYKLSELGPILIFSTHASWVSSIARALMKRVELTKLVGSQPPVAFSYRDNTRSVLASKEWIGDRDVTGWLKNGIGVHYGTLPDVVRSAVEKDFRQGNLGVLVATNTLAQGVNLPVRTVIMHSSWRYDPDIERTKRISSRDYWNIAGRAGRAGHETEGFVVHIVNNDKDEEDFEFFNSTRDNVEPINSSVYQLIQRLIDERITREAFVEELDPELLALLVEEETELTTVHEIEEFINESLAGIQATREENIRANEELKSVFFDISKNILEKIDDPKLRTLYSSTGLSSSSSIALSKHIRDNSSVLDEYLREMGGEELDEFVQLVIPVCMKLTEMQTRYGFSGNTISLLGTWLKGVGITDIIDTYGEQSESSEKFGKYLDDLFGYRLPWGVSSYIRIARELLDMSVDGLSDFAKFFPSMIKFGLPEPIACWAMSIGVPYRESAMLISSAFKDESYDRSYGGFFRWLSELNTERLRYEFNLKGPVLDDVAQAVFNYSQNEHLETYVNLEEFLPITVDVKGTFYENRYLVARQVSVGDSVSIVRDYDNTVDRNAILVKYKGQALGYLPREIAQVLAPEIDAGNELGARVVEVELKTDRDIFVQIRAFCA